MADMKKILIVILLMLPLFASATEPLKEGLDTAAIGGGLITEPSGKTATELVNLRIGSLIKVAFGLLGIIFLILIIVGGYHYMTAGGTEEKIKKGKKYIFNALFGLIILALAYGITQALIEALGGVI